MSKGLIDIIDEYREYFYKEFPTPEHKSVYRNLRKSYLLAMWLNLTVGFTFIHCFYLRSYLFLFYNVIVITLLPGFNGDSAWLLLYICAFEMFRIPFMVFLYNLNLKKCIIDENLHNDDTFITSIDKDMNYLYLATAIAILLYKNYSMDIFVFWHYIIQKLFYGYFCILALLAQFTLIPSLVSQ